MKQIKMKIVNFLRKIWLWVKENSSKISKKIFRKQKQEAESSKKINGGKNLALFISGSLAIAVVLAGASLWLYAADGTIQLDLSRPVLQEAREAQKRAKKEAESKPKAQDQEFSAQGGLNEKDLNDFSRIYNDELQDIHSNEFSEDDLSDKTLKITDQ